MSTVPQERREEFVAGLRELADVYEQRPELPLALSPRFGHCVLGNDDDAGRAEVARIAAILGCDVKNDGDSASASATRKFGNLTFEVFYVSRQRSADWNALTSYRGAVKAPDSESSTGDTSPSVAGAGVGDGPAAPSGPGVAASGPDTPVEHYEDGGWTGEPGQCGVRCACGRIFDGFLAIGEARQLLNEHVDATTAPARIETAAEGARDTITSADATATDPTGVDGRTSLPVRADAVPAAPRGVGAAGITPPSYDPMPTCIYRDTENRIEFHAKYASDLDESNPGWHWSNTDRMSPELAREAEARRRADGIERPYRCEGCDKTSRIAPHGPGCSVAAAFDARLAQNGSGQ